MSNIDSRLFDTNERLKALDDFTDIIMYILTISFVAWLASLMFSDFNQVRYWGLLFALLSFIVIFTPIAGIVAFFTRTLLSGMTEQIATLDCRQSTDRVDDFIKYVRGIAEDE